MESKTQEKTLTVKLIKGIGKDSGKPYIALKVPVPNIEDIMVFPSERALGTVLDMGYFGKPETSVSTATSSIKLPQQDRQ